jgi:heme/copper-type cytochrome/quinol oxidase subunit 2
MAIRTDGSTGRALALAALLFVAAVTLRGYLPGAERAPRETPTDNPAALVVVVVLLLASIGVVTVAVAMRARNRTAPHAGATSRPDWLRRDVGRPSWRAVLIAFGVVLTWLFFAMLLSRLGGGGAPNAPAFVPGSSPESTPPTSSPTAGQPTPPAPQADSSLLSYFYAATVIFLFVLVIGTVVTSRHSHRSAAAGQEVAGRPSAEQPAVGSEALVRAAEVGLAEVEDLSQEPRKAIIACYAAMERELARVPGAAPQDFDTASEVLARAVDQHALGPESATQLVDLFDEARFSPHVMNERHRETAVAVLQRVLAELPSRT